MRVNAPLRLLLAGSAALGALVAGAPALAQDAPVPSTDGPTTVEEVIVTGSRIRRADLVSSSPVATVTSEDLKIASAGTVEEYLNTLPQLVAGSTKGTNVTGESDATASLNLRGLGPQRTLVLVNGRRFMASNQKGIVDVNNIPASLVERVELVTGGASAVYGSDAMAGVVNFILRDHFPGALTRARHGTPGGLRPRRRSKARPSFLSGRRITRRPFLCPPVSSAGYHQPLTNPSAYLMAKTPRFFVRCATKHGSRERVGFIGRKRTA